MVRSNQRSGIMNPARVRRRQRRQARVSDAELDAALGSRKLKVSGKTIKAFTSGPLVRRWVRQLITFTTTVPQAYSANTLAVVDQSEYIVAAIRYNHVRLLRVRAWLTDPSVLLVGLILTETLTNFKVSSEPVTGAAIPSCGIGFSLATRQVPFSTSNVTTLFTVGIEQATTATVIVDVYCEFS